MASVFQSGKFWRAQVRRRGYPSLSATFDTKREALQWAAQIEARLETQTPGQVYKKVVITADRSGYGRGTGHIVQHRRQDWRCCVDLLPPLGILDGLEQGRNSGLDRLGSVPKRCRRSVLRSCGNQEKRCHSH